MNIEKIVEVLIVVALSIVLTTVTYLIGLQLGWILLIDNIEFIGVVLNYSCVILTVRQNIWAWPIGILAVIFLGILFWNYSLYSSLALSILYFLPVQFLGWWAWLKGGKDRTELNVSNLTFNQWGMIIISVLPLYFGVSYLNVFLGGASPFLDTAILIVSILAQYLLIWKKIESWGAWIIVNIVSIYVYGTTGAFLLATQYLLFLGNAVYGYIMWKKDSKNV
jgi:nicotinamide mononucleotide transporter